jgi:CRP-like cAMP-binding protein
MSIEIHGIEKRVLKRGDNFGELAILYNSPRSASIKALVKTYLWGLDRDTFSIIVGEAIIKQYNFTRRFIETVPSFGNIT